MLLAHNIVEYMTLKLAPKTKPTKAALLCSDSGKRKRLICDPQKCFLLSPDLVVPELHLPQNTKAYISFLCVCANSLVTDQKNKGSSSIPSNAVPDLCFNKDILACGHQITVYGRVVEHSAGSYPVTLRPA